MPFCATCGAPVEGRFCAKCGTPVGAAVPPPVTPLDPVGPPPISGGLSDRAAGALCYAFLIVSGVLFLLIEPYSRNRVIRFHAFQAIFLGAAWIAVSIVAGVVFAAVRLYGLSSLVWLAFFILWIYMIVMTYQGRTVVLPVIGPLAQQQAGTI